jgi:lipopolysaccharide export system protein LptC
VDAEDKGGQFSAYRNERLTIATDIAAREMRAWQASGRGDRVRALRRARRHSVWVRRLRVGIPAVALAAVTVLLLVTWFNPLRLISGLPLNPGKLVVSGSKITMEAPRLTGYTGDNRAYSMTAETAAQDLTNPNLVELKTVRARVELKDGGRVEVLAAAGTFDVKSRFLTLTEDVVLVSSNGYEARLDEATLDIQKGHIVSNKPVEVLMLNGKLKASRLEVTDNGAVALFDGGVTMTLRSAGRGAGDPGGGTQERQRAAGE